MLRLRTFGGLSIENAVSMRGATTNRRPLALLALLAVKGRRGLSRDTIVALLWPESDAEHGRNSLSQVISSLRRELAVDDVVLGTAELRVNTDILACDVMEFEHRIATDDHEAAVALYTGPFLDGVFLKNTPAFERWADEERSRLQHVQGDALEQLATRAAAGGDHVAAVRFWRQRASLAPSDSRIALRLMESLDISGDRAGALAHYRVHHTLLREELGVEPDATLAEFASAMRRRTGPSADASTRHTAPVVLESSTPSIDAGSSTHAVAEAITPGGATIVAARRGSRRRGSFTAAVLTIVLVVSAWSLYRGNVGLGSLFSSGRLKSTDEILVGDIAARPQDSLSAHALTELLRMYLGRGNAIVVPRASFEQALHRMELPVTARLDASIAREMATRNGYEAIVAAELTPIGGGFVLSAHLESVGGRELVTASETAASPDDLIPAVGRLARTLRSHIGESPPLPGSRGLEPVTTRSLRALELFTQAQDVSRELGLQQPPRMMTLLYEALAIDSTFAMAHRRLGMALLNMGRTREAIHSLREAVRFQDRLGDVERLTALSSLHGILREHGRALDEATQILRLEPKNPWAANQIAYQCFALREYDRAIRLVSGAIGNTPFWPNVREYQGRGAEALDSARAFYRRHEDSSGSRLLRQARHRLAIFHSVRGSYDSAVWYARPRGDADSGSPMIVAASQFARGQLAAAIATQRRRALAADGELPASAFLAVGESFSALAAMLMNSDPAAASRRLDTALADTAYRNRSGADRHIRPVLALALVGRAMDARREFSAIERAADDDVRKNREPDLELARGAVALAEGRPHEAVAAFHRASGTMTWGSYDSCRVCALPWLGRAFEAAGMPDSAAIAYERFLSTGDPYRILADAAWRATILNRLGVLHAQRGDTARAVRRWSEFVELWANADAELQPRVAEARRRLAALRRD